MNGEFLRSIAEKSILSTDPLHHLYVLPDNAPLFDGVEHEGVEMWVKNILNEDVKVTFIKASQHVKTQMSIETMHRRVKAK